MFYCLPMSRRLNLPPELERDIFELAARADRRQITQLIRIAHRVHIWIEPILYESLEFGMYESKYKIPLFLRTMNARPNTFFAKTVKSISFLPHITLDQVTRILSVCTGIIHLTAGPIPFAALTDLRVRRMSIALESLVGLPRAPYFNLPMFSAVTHLRIYDDVSWPDMSFGLLPSLTHLALTAYAAKEWSDVCIGGLRNALASCRLLKILLLHSWHESLDEEHQIRQRLAAIKDHRLVLLSRSPEHSSPWARIEDEWWVRAEELAAKQIYESGRG